MAAQQDPWPGLATDLNPHMNPGARVQDNCMSLSPGTLTGRGGIREVWFENAAARSPVNPLLEINTLPDILALTTLRRAEGDYVIFMDSDGALMAGRRPT